MKKKFYDFHPQKVCFQEISLLHTLLTCIKKFLPHRKKCVCCTKIMKNVCFQILFCSPPPAKKSNECSLIRNTPFPSYTYQLPCFGSHVLYGSALKSGLILSVNNGISLFHLSGQVGVILRNLHFPVCCHQCPPALLSLHIAHTSFSTCLSPVKMKHYFKYNFTK